MKVLIDQEFKDSLIRQIAEREFSVRTGVHCSDLIYCLNKAALRRAFPLPSTEREVLTFSLGWATQRWLTGRPDDETTVEIDGIQVTPDATWMDCPWELKATFTSSEKSVVENDSWIKQIMAQCYVTKRLTARLSRMELMGNWKSIFGKAQEKHLPANSKPTLSCFRLDFSQEELDSNWLWLKGRRVLFVKLVDKPNQLLQKSLALPPEHAWECEFCQETYKNLCEGQQPANPNPPPITPLLTNLF